MKELHKLTELDKLTNLVKSVFFKNADEKSSLLQQIHQLTGIDFDIFTPYQNLSGMGVIARFYAAYLSGIMSQKEYFSKTHKGLVDQFLLLDFVTNMTEKNKHAYLWFLDIFDRNAQKRIKNFFFLVLPRDRMSAQLFFNTILAMGKKEKMEPKVILEKEELFCRLMSKTFTPKDYLRRKLQCQWREIRREWLIDLVLRYCYLHENDLFPQSIEIIQEVSVHSLYPDNLDFGFEGWRVAHETHQFLLDKFIAKIYKKRRIGENELWNLFGKSNDVFFAFLTDFTIYRIKRMFPSAKIAWEQQDGFRQNLIDNIARQLRENIDLVLKVDNDIPWLAKPLPISIVKKQYQRFYGQTIQEEKTGEIICL